MKNLKLLFLTLLSVLSFNLYSQSILAVTNASGPNICDGTILIDTVGIQLNTIYVTSNSVIISQGSYYITNLCPGDYYVTSMTVNGGYNTDSLTITYNTVGINEVTLDGKYLVRVLDLTGRETNVVLNQPLIYVYSDGSKEIRYINE